MMDMNQFVQTFKVGQKSSDFFITSHKDKYYNQIDFNRNETDQLTSVTETKELKNLCPVSLSFSKEASIGWTTLRINTLATVVSSYHNLFYPPVKWKLLALSIN